LKGLLIAGGNGTRLAPSTSAVNKHLLPVFDKPLIYYSLSTLMLSGIRDIHVVIRGTDLYSFSTLLGDGTQFGISLTYGIQNEPKGIADTIRVASEYISADEFALALGDNMFFGSGLTGMLSSMTASKGEARIVLKEVSDPDRFGIAWLSESGSILKIEEKPHAPNSNLAITGLYFLPGNALEIVRNLEPSTRGELEITDVLQSYVSRNLLKSWKLPRGTMWLDTGTIESLMDASTFVRSFQALSGQLIGSPHEISWRNKWIDDSELEGMTVKFGNSYGEGLKRLLEK
jgi:glucose-1-phosphate thymidylyltransferase